MGQLGAGAEVGVAEVVLVMVRAAGATAGMAMDGKELSGGCVGCYREAET